MKQPIFTYENGHAKCIAEDSMGRQFIGEAWCADTDQEFESQLTGLTIAEARAQIAAARTYRDDIKNKLSALKQLLYSMNQSKNFNRHSYEAKMLYRQIKLHELDLEIAKHQLAVLKLDLFEYINEKDVYHKKLKEMREKYAKMYDDKQHSMSRKSTTKKAKRRRNSFN